MFTTLLRERVHLPEDHARRDLAVHRAHAARPLHRGHVPDLRLPAGPRRPVRQLRQPARPDRPDQPEVADQRRDAAVRRAGALSSSTCPRSPRCSAPGCSRKSGHWRPNVLKFSLNLLDDLQPRAITRDLDWGVPVPLDGWRDRPDKRIYVWFDAVIGYLSACVEWARRSGDPDAWRAWWKTRTPRPTTSWARTTSSSTRRSGRRCCSATPDAGRKGGTAGPLATSTCPPRSSSSEYLTMEGSSSPPAARWSSTCATSSPATTWTRCATTWRRRPGDPGHRLHLERVRPPQQRRAGRDLGQPGQPRGFLRGAEHRFDPGSGRADRRGPRAARRIPAGIRYRRRPSVPVALQVRDHRRDAHRRRGQQVLLRAGAVEAA